ncbi:hypothetical protein CDEF62S_00373 [Castellaniella defragrans]
MSDLTIMTVQIYPLPDHVRVDLVAQGNIAGRDETVASMCAALGDIAVQIIADLDLASLRSHTIRSAGCRVWPQQTRTQDGEPTK